MGPGATAGGEGRSGALDGSGSGSVELGPESGGPERGLGRTGQADGKPDAFGIEPRRFHDIWKLWP